MKKNIKMIYITEITLLFLTIIFYLLTKMISSNLKSYLAIIFLLIVLIPLLIIFGFKNNKNYYSNYITRVILMILMIFGIMMYASGLFFGFSKGYLLSFSSVINSIIPIIVITILSEILRYIVVKYSHGNLKSMIIFTLILSAFQIILEINYGALNTGYEKFVFLCTIMIPIVAENFLCTYLVYHGNITPSLIFKLTIELYMYIIPIVPNLGNYLYASVKIIVPYVSFYIINKNLIQQEESKTKFSDNNKRVITGLLFAFGIVIIVLVSGIFKYKLIAVASDSMADVFYRGDAVIVEYVEPRDIKLGDILVFNYDGKVITHRVIGIELVDQKLYFNTKGDANDVPDGFITTEENVIGKVDYVIKYIGYPTLWANELFRKG